MLEYAARTVAKRTVTKIQQTLGNFAKIQGDMAAIIDAGVRHRSNLVIAQRERGQERARVVALQAKLDNESTKHKVRTAC